jgi:alkanesulfonate monooxygenase SsuD/methylene tetrahydromethanopterin reductase-like flavin-dependent oxidoreductase (luciferase family)
MKFDILYHVAVPKPWDDESEHKKIKEAIAQIELADRLGFHTAWAVEHHFLEENSMSSAPEVWLAAAAGRTKNIRIGHGILALPPQFNHPFRSAERIAMLDLISDGRLELGVGESSSDLELKGFGVSRDEKKAIATEALDAVVRMMTEVPFAGYHGKYIDLPQRNVVPKPYQKPHPPLWLACTNRHTIAVAGQRGMGALTFAFADATEAKQHVAEYYAALEEAVPSGLSVNARVAQTAGLMCCEDEDEALEKGLEGLNFFSYTMGHFYFSGKHRPGRMNLWEEYEGERAKVGVTDKIDPVEKDAASAEDNINAGTANITDSLRGAVGTPAQLRELFRGFEDAGIDEMILFPQHGNTKHEDICASMELLAREVMPEFLERDAKRCADKAQRLAPVIERAMARRPNVAPELDPDYVVPAFGVPY